MTDNNTPTRGFKRKTIEATIRAKMKEWIKTLPNKELQDEVQRDYIVTGGAIASMLMGHLPNDYDVYFRTPEVAQKVAKHYISHLTTDEKVRCVDATIEGNRVRVMIRSVGIAQDGQEDFGDYEYFESMDPKEAEKYFERYAKSKQKSGSYKAAMISSNAITLHDNVQIIMRFVGAPEEIHKNYDFVHCTNWFTDADGLTLNQAALESILAKELKYVGSLYPICSLFRIKKFVRRGWTITAGEMLKIAWDINKLDLNDINVLMEQLIGVDAAYFHQLIHLLKDKENIDRTYLVEAINRIFDTNEFEKDIQPYYTEE